MTTENPHRPTPAAFKKRLLWVAIAGFVAACLVAAVLVLSGPTTPSILFAAAIGTFLAFTLGAGLMTTSFYSDDSGYDRNPTFVSSDGRDGE